MAATWRLSDGPQLKHHADNLSIFIAVSILV